MSDYIELARQLRLLAKVDECSQRPPVNGRFDRTPCERCEYRDRCFNSPPPDFSAIFNEAAYAIEALHGEIDSLHELGKADRLLVLPEGLTVLRLRKRLERLSAPRGDSATSDPWAAGYLCGCDDAKEMLLCEILGVPLDEEEPEREQTKEDADG